MLLKMIYEVGMVKIPLLCDATNLIVDLLSVSGWAVVIMAHNSVSFSSVLMMLLKFIELIFKVSIVV